MTDIPLSDVTSQSQPQSRHYAPDPLEVRLASAEKQVALALDADNHDQLISVASNALAEKSSATAKNIVKSRKNLLWARSHAYNHKGLLDLALKDARAALKLDPDEPSSYIRTAALLAEAKHLSQAESCLDKAASLAQRLDSSTRSILLRKIEKQRNKISANSASLMHRLPNELLEEIARQADSAGLLAMSRTCSMWRHILTSCSSLWTSMHLHLTIKQMSVTKAAAWLNHVQFLADRSNNALESITFSGRFPQVLLRRVLSILRASAHSLRHLEIPARFQMECYQELYRHCPRLKSLLPGYERDVKIDGDPARLDAIRDASLAPSNSPSEAFSLESLVIRPGTTGWYPDLGKHALHLRILKGIDPFSRFLDGRFYITGRARALYLLSQSLEDWSAGLYQIEGAAPARPHTRGWALTFPKLVRLTDFEASEKLHFTFPALLELEISFQQRMWPTKPITDELIRLVSTSPFLRKLHIECIELHRVSRPLQQTLRALRDVTDLTLHLPSATDYICDLLLPKMAQLDSGEACIEFPFTQLRSLRMSAGRTDLSRLAFSLIVRDRVRAGEDLGTATKFAEERVKSLQKSSAKSTTSGGPFQRATSANSPSTSLSSNDKEKDKKVGPCLGQDEAARCCRLETLKLYHLAIVPPHAEQLLRSLVPEAILEYDPL